VDQSGGHHFGKRVSAITPGCLECNDIPSLQHIYRAKVSGFPKFLTELQIFIKKAPPNIAHKRNNARLVVYSLTVDLGASPGAKIRAVPRG
jgi:hypothetical protein